MSLRLPFLIKIVKRVLYWHDWERYSNRQETRMKMGGFMGEITYEGDFEPFLPYIRLGEYMHVGKGSSFGLGRYEVA
jgi:CRISPR/Cas system endoribonuclease Cas6 (RAMP superfamily)